MINFLLLKSLHSTLKLTIIVCDASFTVLKEFNSAQTISSYYDYRLILNDFTKTNDNFLFHYGFLGE
ncbi:AraC family transcriptional regulator, partial [Streptococcus uberis]